MKYKAIFFDMDGTLVPMDTQSFTGGYFKFLYAKLAHHGLDPKSFASDMWAGVAAMVKNDGSKTNEDAFWEVFTRRTGVAKEAANPDCLDFYGNEFHAAKAFTEENPLAADAIHAAREKAELVVLSTNPLFPMVGQHTRMSWVGLAPEDFDLITAYESERYCKPNPMYFTDICRRLSLEPGECLLIGNDEKEDMYAGTAAGLDCWLVTDWMIPSAEHPWKGPRGTFAQTLQMLRELD